MRASDSLEGSSKSLAAWEAAAEEMQADGSAGVHALQENSARINSIDFHRTEDLLITGSDDDSIHVYSTQSGQCTDVLYSKKYGVSHVLITHHSTSALYATRKVCSDDGDE